MAEEQLQTLQYASEYQIEICELYTVSGLKLDILDSIAGINIYEDIFNNAITGDISIVDTNSLISNGPIIGQEKLRLKISTPQGTERNRQTAIDFTDVPLHIFKIDSMMQINDATQGYTLRFTSAEFVRNNRIRLSQSFSGEPAEDIVKKIIRDEDLLNSKKEFYYEKTSNNFNLIAPNQHPFNFINSLAKRCLSANYNYSPSFVFYETTKGYYFRTIDSLMDRKNPKMVYKELIPNMLDERTGTINPADNLTNIISHTIVSATNTLLNTRTGMYGGKLTLIDLYNKQKKDYTYNYADEFENVLHTDTYSRYNLQENPVLSEAVDDFGRRITDYSDAVVYCQTTDRETPDGLYNPSFEQQYDYNGLDQWLMQRRSRMTSLENALTMRLEVPGNTVLQAGDLVGLIIRNKTDGDTSNPDPYLTGRYLVKKLRHHFLAGQGQPKHTIHMEVVRDTISQPYPSHGVVYPAGASEGVDALIPRGSEDPSNVIF